MIFSYHWLKESFKNLPRPEKLAQILNLFSFETEVKKHNQELVLEVDILPNRYEAASYFGLAKEIYLVLPQSKIKSHILNLYQKPSLKKFFSGPKKVDFEIEVRESQLVPRYLGVIVKGLKNQESPEFLKKRLAFYGINSYNLIVDLTNYVMLETGQPLHAFDLEKIRGKKIIIRKAKPKEKITALDGKQYSLDQEILVISDKFEPLAIAGIKGGQKAEVDFDSQQILFEAATFDQRTIYLGAKKLKLETEASIRFSHQLSVFLPQIAMARLMELVFQFFKEAKIEAVFDLFSKPKKKIIPFNFKKYQHYLGEAVSLKKAKQIFKRMSASIRKESFEKILIEPPKERIDLNLEIDLFEEIARVIGYQKLRERTPQVLIFPKKENQALILEEKARDIFSAMGFNEAYNYSLISSRIWPKRDEIEVLNPVSSEFDLLRENFIFNFLKNVSFNFKFFKEVKIFEIGKVFFKKGNQFLEEKHLGAVLARKNQKEVNEVFYEIKGALESFFERNGLDRDDYKILEAPKNNPFYLKIKDFFHPLKLGFVFDDRNNYLGFIGEVKESFLEKFKISLKETPAVCLFEINLEKLLNLILWEREFEPLSKYPALIRDLSLIVASKIKVAQVMNLIYGVSPYVKDVDLFDIYFGSFLKEGKKSMAFHIVFQAEDRTLTDEEVNREMKKIAQKLKEKLNAEIR